MIKSKIESDRKEEQENKRRIPVLVKNERRAQQDWEADPPNAVFFRQAKENPCRRKKKYKKDKRIEKQAAIPPKNPERIYFALFLRKVA